MNAPAGASRACSGSAPSAPMNPPDVVHVVEVGEPVGSVEDVGDADDGHGDHAPADGQAARARRLTLGHQRHAGSDETGGDGVATEADEPPEQRLHGAPERTGEVEVDGQADEGAADDQPDADQLVLRSSTGAGATGGVGALPAGRARLARLGGRGSRGSWLCLALRRAPGGHGGFTVPRGCRPPASSADRVDGQDLPSAATTTSSAPPSSDWHAGAVLHRRRRRWTTNSSTSASGSSATTPSSTVSGSNDSASAPNVGPSAPAGSAGRRQLATDVHVGSHAVSPRRWRRTG